MSGGQYDPLRMGQPYKGQLIMPITVISPKEDNLPAIASPNVQTTVCTTFFPPADILWSSCLCCHHTIKVANCSSASGV